MKPRLLFIIDSDPRTSPRPAEAVRIAAGISAWKKVHVDVCLRGPAELIAGEDAEFLIDGDNLSEHLRLVTDSGGAIRTPQNLSDEELAKLAAASTTLLHF